MVISQDKRDFTFCLDRASDHNRLCIGRRINDTLAEGVRQYPQDTGHKFVDTLPFYIPCVLRRKDDTDRFRDKKRKIPLLVFYDPWNLNFLRRHIFHPYKGPDKGCLK